MGRKTIITTVGENFRKNAVDILLLLALSSFGLFILITINTGLATQQLVYIVSSIAILIILSLIDKSLLLWLAPFGYITGVFLLLLSFLGPVIRGARRWIMIGSSQLQTSELAKPLFLLALCTLIAKYPPKTLKNVIVHSILFAVPFILVFKQPDLGTSLVYGASWIAMMVAGGFPLRWLVALALFGSTLLPFTWNHLQDYQKNRVYTFVNPTLDPKGAGYNAIQSMITVGSGELFGRGLGRGTQSHLRFLPEYHTDFIFATLIEELGLVGGLAMLFFYGVLMVRIIGPLIRGSVSDIIPFVYSVGLASMILTQMFINMGMNMGIIPITGITLPFVSYGGSSILSIAIAFSFLWVIRR